MKLKEVENYSQQKERSENQTVEIVVTKIENRGTMTWQEFVEKLLSFNEILDAEQKSCHVILW